MSVCGWAKHSHPIQTYMSINSEVHLTGTMKSSCGETWNFTYDCYSGCTASGTLNNLAQVQSAINAACGTNVTGFEFTFPQS